METVQYISHFVPTVSLGVTKFFVQTARTDSLTTEDVLLPGKLSLIFSFIFFTKKAWVDFHALSTHTIIH